MQLFLNSVLHIVVKRGSDRLVHPVVASLLIDHALVELFLFDLTVTATLPVGRPAHLDKTAVVESAADVLARIHRHVSD